MRLDLQTAVKPVQRGRPVAALSTADTTCTRLLDALLREALESISNPEEAVE